MLGAIIGDIVGSRFEWNNIKTKEFEFFTDECFFTDDSIMTLAVAKALTDSNKDAEKLRSIITKTLQQVGQPYPNCGYGGMFSSWMYSDNPKPYSSYGNGAAMRVSPCAYAADSLEEALELAQIVTEITHNHPEGIKGAKATTAAIYLVLNKKTIPEIREHINDNYYPMDFTLDSIRDSYKFYETCHETVPQAITAFLESTSYEDAIRNAISIGGDSDTLAAITGGIAEAYYGIPKNIKEKGIKYLDTELLNILYYFNNIFVKR